MDERLKYFKLAKDINNKYKIELREKQAHCRGSINSMSLISLNYDTPEMSFKTSFNINDDISTLLQNKPLKPKRSVPEKVLQATIINSAINCDNHYLPFGNKIKFITSEMAIGDNKIVNDLLCFSEEKGLYIIELKYKRDQKELISQVNNFEKVIRENILLFKELVNDIYKCNWDGVKVQKAIVWPCNNNPKSTTSEKFHKNHSGYIEEYCYDRDKLDNEKKLIINQIR